MTIKITPEAVKERIAALESAGELSLKEQFYLEAPRLLMAGMDSKPVILYRQVNPVNGMKTYWAELDPEEFRHLKKYTDENAEFMTLYRHAQQPVVPDGIERVASMAEYLGNFAAAAIIRQLAVNQPQNAQQNIPEIIPDSCTWTFSNYDDHWSGTCGVEWIFPDGGPEENGVKFCPKCGKSVAVSATEGTEE